MRRKLIWAGVGVAVVAAIGVAGLGVFRAEEERPVYADATDQALVAQGRTVYAQQCASCHGADLAGQENWQSLLPDGGRPAPPHDETGHTWHHPDELLFVLTKYGGQPYSPPDYQNNMPAFEGTLSDEEILAALAYIKSTWPPRVQAQQARVNQRTR